MDDLIIHIPNSMVLAGIGGIVSFQLWQIRILWKLDHRLSILETRMGDVCPRWDGVTDRRSHSCKETTHGC